MNLPRFLLPAVLLFTGLSSLQAQTQPTDIRYSISMNNPANHYIHVEMECENIRNNGLNVKMPAWTPGYYWLINYAKNVVNFRAKTATGKDLKWSKTNKNTWHIAAEGGKVTVSYDLYAFSQSVADAWVDTGFAYLPPAAVFMHPDGALQQASTVKVTPYAGWKQCYTGLNPLPGKDFTYTASNFDELYDCPFLLGNQYSTAKTINNIPHRLVLQDTAGIDVPGFFSDLEKMIKSANTLMGHVPYKHYTFLIMGEGRGGLEHRNSTAVFSGGPYGKKDSDSYKRWLNFLAHEYFHLYNIKAIRPIALGPFDYDKENYTNMLWVSEGFTVYYEYLILNRAGILNRQDVYNMLRSDIAAYENSPGHLFQSATASSFDTWLQFFNHNPNTAVTTISYYNKGCALGLLLDLKIRHETRNKKSLDDVMRHLYKEFYQEKQRGFKDEEFRQVCENIAGVKLDEIFDVYATTTAPIDYPKYLAYAGLEIDLTPGKAFPVVFDKTGSQKNLAIKDMDKMNELQTAINKSWVKN